LHGIEGTPAFTEQVGTAANRREQRLPTFRSVCRRPSRTSASMRN